jgi:hypothetical protein
MKMIKKLFLFSLLIISQTSFGLQITDGRIDVRENSEGKREFYTIKTGEKFSPIGFNYISAGNRVTGIQKNACSHTLFDVNGIIGWEQHR